MATISKQLPYFFTYEQYANKTLDEFSQILKDHTKKIVGDISLQELCSMTEHPNGIYFFFDEAGLCYVGKTTSRSFIERIPSHFDQREVGWLNTLPKKIKNSSKLGYAEALSRSLNMELVMMGIQDKEITFKLERVFRSYLKPALNSCKKEYSGSDQLSKLRIA